MARGKQRSSRGLSWPQTLQRSFHNSPLLALMSAGQSGSPAPQKRCFGGSNAAIARAKGVISSSLIGMAFDWQVLQSFVLRVTTLVAEPGVFLVGNVGVAIVLYPSATFAGAITAGRASVRHLLPEAKLASGPLSLPGHCGCHPSSASPSSSKLLSDAF